MSRRTFQDFLIFVKCSLWRLRKKLRKCIRLMLEVLCENDLIDILELNAEDLKRIIKLRSDLRKGN
jgi:hypothetical protein